MVANFTTLSKNDLCADKVTLDYNSMKETAAIAYFESWERISELLYELRGNDNKPNCDAITRICAAERLFNHAKALLTAAEMYSTLIEGINRTDLVVVR